MFRQIKLLILGSLIAACSTVATCNYLVDKPVECTRTAGYMRVDPKVAGLVDEFMFLARQNGAECFWAQSISFDTSDNIQIAMGSPKKYILGYCSGFGNIVLNQEAWDQNSPIVNKALLFHEMGHCTFHLQHAAENSVNIMTPYILSEEVLTENWDLLMHKLFTKFLDQKGEVHVFFNRHSVQ